MKNILKTAYIVLFLAALCAVPVSFPFIKDKEFSENENRYLAAKPDFSFSGLTDGEFTKEAEKYIDDQFPLRDLWTSAKVNILKAVGCRDINGVYLCEDGYLIEKWLDSDFNSKQLKENISAVNLFLTSHKSEKSSVIIVPTALEILSEKLPYGPPVFDQNDAFEIIEENIDSEIFYNPEDILIKHNNEYIYYRTDHHWTSYGAFLTYCGWTGKSEDVTVKEYDITCATNSFLGSLYSKVPGLKCKNDEIFLYNERNNNTYTVSYDYGRTENDSIYADIHLSEKDKYLVFLDGNHPEITIKTSVKNNRKLLIFKDSYANSFIPFLLSDYEEIHIIDPRYFNRKIDEYISENGINEFLFLYNIKNFCEDSSLSKVLNTR